VTEFRQRISDQRGQDLIEYALLLEFACLVSAALFIGVGQQLAGIWQTAKLILAIAAKSVK
jgi:hypothetical protein